MFASLRRSALVVTAATFLGTTPAAALSVEEVHRVIESWLAEAVASSNGEFVTKGDLTVQQSGSDIVVRFPAMLLAGKEAAIEVPDAVLRLQPEDEDRIGFTAHISDHLRIFDISTAQQTATLTIGSHRIAGLYRPSILYVQDVVADFNDVRLSNGQVSFRVGSMALNYDGKEVAPDNWNIDGEFAVDNVELVSASGSPMLSLARLVQKVRAENVKQRKYAREVKRIFGEDGMPDFVFMTPDQLRQLEPLMLAAPDFFGAFDIELMLDDLAIPSLGETGMRIGQFRLSGGMEPSEADLSRLSFNARLSDLALPTKGTSQVPAALMPAQLDLEAHVDRFPGSAIWHDFITMSLDLAAAKREAATPEEAEALGAAVIRSFLKSSVPQLLATMADANTIFGLPKLELEAGPASLTGKAEIGLPPGLPDRPFAADAVITGLDELMQQLTSASKPADQNAVGTLALLRGLGRPEQGPGGEMEYHYKLSRAPDGTLLLNGLALAPPQPQ